MDYFNLAKNVNSITKEQMLKILQDEPVYKKAKYRGYLYEVKRSELLQSYCGYVYVPNSTLDSNRMIFELNRIDCHGGITYYDDERIGFDTSHFNDLIPRFFLDGIGGISGVYRDINFCENECKKIINQLIKIGNSYNVILLKK